MILLIVAILAEAAQTFTCFSRPSRGNFGANVTSQGLRVKINFSLSLATVWKKFI